ncbi:Trans-enoyl reductase [Lachnellula willkommii]|uniref:Trans-enoyl reductase n=1 Tax=Lachnellula willkommii TaxID=215461 RepID=A0A559MBR7_9HELO|nr:Trans-enoyl reductase [Lachnellula willkommii]
MSPPTLLLPTHQDAIVADQSGNLAISTTVPLPEIRSDEILIQTTAVAINPSDVKLIGQMAAPAAIAGSDCAGIVVAVGEIAQERFKVGDRVCAPTVPMDPLNPLSGAFTEYVPLVADFALKVPKTLPLEHAAALGTGVATIGYALFRSLCIPGHPEKKAMEPAIVLVWGGSSATGTMAIQLIRRSGCIPITACSPKNFALVKSRGAEKAFDYHDSECAAQIKAYTGNALDFALDCVCDAQSMQACYAAIGRAGGSYTTLEPYHQKLHTRKRIRPNWILGIALFGREIGWKDPYHVEADAELRDFGRRWFQCVQSLLDRGEIQAHPVRIGNEVGFEGVMKGITLMKQKTVSGEKLVYRLKDTR